jgi:anaerobic selenocysteine-containing dehydrogenase
MDRRKFITGMALAGGAGMGLMLSPTPWYLLRDAAFWTQNWSWVPTPPSGAPSYENTVCRMCGAGCGITVRKIDDRLVRIDGNRDHPVNKGSVCPVGIASLEMLYGPARIKCPLKKVGGRESSSWESVSWEAALSEINNRIAQLRSSEQSHTIACISGNAKSTANQLLKRLLLAVGSRNFITMNANAEGLNTVHSLMHGSPAAAYDVENARCIFSFGCSLFEGWGATGRMYHARSVWANQPEDARPEIIQIESNLSSTANQASRWVPLKPGTEAALALGIAHVMVREGIFDKTFVDKHCFGFHDWQDAEGRTHKGFASEVMASYSPHTVERITTVPAREIEELAYLLSSSRPALALAGGGRGDRFADLYSLMAVHSLNALVGNIGQRGGISNQFPPPIRPLPPINKDKESERALSVARADEAGSSKYPFARSLPHNVDTRQIQLLFIHEANPYYVLPERQLVKDLFEDVPFIVSLSPYMDESSAHADFILPLPTPLERWDDLYEVSGLPYPVYNLCRPLTPPLHDTRNAGDIAIGIAHALGGAVAESFPWNSIGEVLKERAEGLYEANCGMIVEPQAVQKAATNSQRLQERFPTYSSFWASLIESGCWFDPAVKSAEAKRVQTPSGKIELYSRSLQNSFGFTNDLQCVPHYVEPDPAPEGFDLTIMPEEMITVARNGLGSSAMLLKQLSDTVLQKDELFVRINPVTAMNRNIKEGDKILVESARGLVQVRVHISSAVREGVVLLPLGLGHTAYDQFLRNKGVNGCQLLKADKDPLSGLPCCCGTPARIRKV